jgi:tetratricopeptide (TPR) repeat protein
VNRAELDAKNALTVLNHLAERRPDQAVQIERALAGRLEGLAFTALRVAVETEGPLGRELAREVDRACSLELAMDLMSLCASDDYYLSVPIREVALAVTGRVYDGFLEIGAEEPEEFREASLAMLAHNRGAWLQSLGRYGEAVAAGREAVERYRRLADFHPEADLSDLAGSLDGLSRSLTLLGEFDEALAASEDAAAIYRDLADADKERWMPELARCLLGQSRIRLDLGHRDVALRLAVEADALNRRLFERDPAAFRSQLGRGRNHLGLVLRETGAYEEALEAIGEANEIRQALAAERPDIFLPELANGLETLASVLDEVGRPAAALPVNLEAIGLRRRLARDRGDTFTAELARALGRHSLYLAATDSRDEALAASGGGDRSGSPALQQAGERCPHRSGGGARQPGRGLPDPRPARGCSGTGRGVGRGAACACIPLSRPLSASSGERAVDPGLGFLALGRAREAVASARQAVAIRRQLARRHPAVFAPDLATALSHLAIALRRIPLLDEALQVADEAATLFERLETERPGSFRAAAASSLCQKAALLGELGRKSEAVAGARQALAILRALSDDRPAGDVDLAEALNNLGGTLMASGNPQEGLELATEAVEVYRRLAGRRPAAFESFLAVALHNRALCLLDLDRPEEALESSLEALSRLLHFGRHRPLVHPLESVAMAKLYERTARMLGQEPDSGLLAEIADLLAGGGSS